ncbi:hypothetical protein LCGC14_0164770 [marine sediment metagenome]|uniref:Uncharacterized protein n=1 Tax=marine sediment metagenome TaxID=412755 RepID=A0A0F9XWP7_9ZZZZ
MLRKMIDEPYCKQPVFLPASVVAMPDGTQQPFDQQPGRIVEIIGDSEVKAGYHGKQVRFATPDGNVFRVGTFYLRTMNSADIAALMQVEKAWLDQPGSEPPYAGLLPGGESD